MLQIEQVVQSLVTDGCRETDRKVLREDQYFKTAQLEQDQDLGELHGMEKYSAVN